MWGLLAGAILLAAVVIVVVTSSSPGANHSGYTGVVDPEGVRIEPGPNLAAYNPRLTGAGVDGVQCSTNEQLAFHVHAHLAIFVNGSQRSVPYGIGMVPPVATGNVGHGITEAQGSQTCLYWLHTHYADGIIHIESPVQRTFVLGQLFDEWGQILSATQVGSAHGPVTAFVNGKRWNKPLINIPLVSHGSIQLDVGTPVVKPYSVDWPSSL